MIDILRMDLHEFPIRFLFPSCSLIRFHPNPILSNNDNNVSNGDGL